MNRRKKYIEGDRALEQPAQTECGVSSDDTEIRLGAFWTFWREPALGGEESRLDDLYISFPTPMILWLLSL